VASVPERLVRRADASHLACVIPMYNEGGHAERFLRELHAHVAARFATVTIIVVDDGSRDETVDEVRLAILQGLPVHLIRLSRNFGKEIALTAGLAATERLAHPAAAVLVIDGDFQHPFAAVSEMIERWEQGIDMVYGVQVRRETEGVLRRLLTWLFYRLLRSPGGRFTIPRDAGDFRLLDRRVVRALNLLPERSRYMKGLYAWVGFSSAGVRFEALPRPHGRSSFGISRLSELALDGLTAFTSWPLRVASLSGVIVSFLAFLYGCWIVFERLYIGQPIPGFATLAAAIMFFSGIQLMSIGLLGEYIGRVFLEVKGRPLYIVAEEAGTALTVAAEAEASMGVLAQS
jgi:polyisoprenyl-phosphate glycosyltransferase